MRSTRSRPVRLSSSYLTLDPLGISMYAGNQTSGRSGSGTSCQGWTLMTGSSAGGWCSLAVVSAPSRACQPRFCLRPPARRATLGGGGARRPSLSRLGAMRKLQLGVSPRDGLLALVVGGLSAAAFPPVGGWPLAVVAVALGLWLLRDRDP